MVPTPDILLKVDIRGALRDLVPFVQFIKREKHPWRNVSSTFLVLIRSCVQLQ